MAFVPQTTFAMPQTGGLGAAAVKPARYRTGRSANEATVAKLVKAEIQLLRVVREVEMYALLEVVGKPINSNKLIGVLGICQSRASTLLRKLVNSGCVKRTRDPLEFYVAYLYEPIKPPVPDNMTLFRDACVSGVVLSEYVAEKGLNNSTLTAYVRRQVYAGVIALDAETGRYRITEFGKQFTTEGRKAYITKKWQERNDPRTAV